MKIVLHFGFPKTGTTYLQQILYANADPLQRAGLVYPVAGNDFKQRALKYLTLRTGRNTAHPELYMLRAAIDAAVARNPHTSILLSVEEISGAGMSRLDSETVGSIRDFLGRWTEDVRLIAYVRRVEDYYLSTMQEKLKRSGGIVAPDKFRANFSRIIRIYEDSFGTEARVRPFEQSQWHNGDLLDDFLQHVGDLAGVEVGPLDRDGRRANESLSAETMLVLDVLRRFPDRMAEKLRYDFKRSERLWRRLRDIAQRSGYSSKPLLFSSVADIVAEGNRHDMDSLRERFGIRFERRAEGADEPIPAESARLSEVEAIVPVDRDRALRIISAYCAESNV